MFFSCFSEQLPGKDLNGTSCLFEQGIQNLHICGYITIPLQHINTLNTHVPNLFET